MPFRRRCCWGLCAVIARQAQPPRTPGAGKGRRVSRAKEWAELQALTNGRYGKIELDPM